jgi:hypothetical protein
MIEFSACDRHGKGNRPSGHSSTARIDATWIKTRIHGSVRLFTVPHQPLTIARAASSTPCGHVENGVVLTAGSVRSTFTSLPDLLAFFAAFFIAFFSFLNFLLSLDIACSSAHDKSVRRKDRSIPS